MTDESGKAVIRCFVKGAPDQLLARAATVLDPDAGPVPLDGRLRERYLADNHRFAEEGLRVMATARRDFDPAAFDPGADLLPLVTDLELLALVGIVDPPRPGARASVGQAKSAGIEVRMITGDHAVTAAAIARQLGIDGKVISGAEFGAMTDDEAMKAIADVGVIARVTPEHKVRLVDMLKREGQIVAMTGDGVNDAPALKKADIGIAMGETGTEVAKQAAVMVLTDDNFSTITKAVEIGRGLYDNLVRYIRFEMGCMFGFIITFLGASIFDIARGEPLLPLQVLWVAFTTVTIQSIGLGYSKPVEGLMERRPRPPSQPILSGGVLSWLVTVGLVMAIGTLSVVGWAEQAHTLAVARTMGVVVFSLFNLFFSLESRHRRESVFSLSTFADRTCIVTTGASLFLLVMATVLAPCQAILKTTALDVDQWLLCAAVALSIIAVTEIRKAFLQQTVGPVRLRRWRGCPSGVLTSPGGQQLGQRGGQVAHLVQVGPRQPGDDPVAILGQLHPGHAGVVRILPPSHQARRLGPVHQPHRAMAAQHQVAGDLADRRRHAAGMALDRHEQLMLDMGQARGHCLVLAPALEAPQRDPESQQVLERLDGGWFHLTETTPVVPRRPGRGACRRARRPPRRACPV
jgi:Ca2+-transporting ATPase